MLWLDTSMRHSLCRTANSSAPHEACGLLLGRLDDASSGEAGTSLRRVLGIVAARNVHAHPHRGYVVSPDDLLAADRLARRHGWETLGVYHSHPNGPARPSETDHDEAWEGLSYVIVGRGSKTPWTVASFRKIGERLVEERCLHGSSHQDAST